MYGAPHTRLLSHFGEINFRLSCRPDRAILHDPATFPEPARFRPERWLRPGAPAFPDVAFGFGRRECPGRYMARESVWMSIVGTLAAFEISAVPDDPPKALYPSGIVACVG